MATKREIEEKIQIAYGHLPYMINRTFIEISHFFELFTKYHVINSETDVGFAEQMKWEGLVESYLEKVHSCIDKQRKVYTNTCDFLGLNLHEERDQIIQPVSVEHKIITELRNTLHHRALVITRFWARSVNGKSEPLPGLADFECRYTDEQKKYMEKFSSQSGGVLELFRRHCEEMIKKSNSLRALLLENLNK